MTNKTIWPRLRAMARNYPSGKHVWDHLDADACEKGAEEIRHLHQIKVEQAKYIATLEKALAECRDAFPSPEYGSHLENLRFEAISDPLAVPSYVKEHVRYDKPWIPTEEEQAMFRTLTDVDKVVSLGYSDDTK